MSRLHENSLKALNDIRAQAKDNRKVVFVCGNFNIVHPGHLRLLRFASECGDFLVVGVMSDGNEGTHVPEGYRLEGIAATSWVDYAFILRDHPEDFIKELQPLVVVKGREHENKNNPEHPILLSYGGKLLFCSGDTSFSSINLLRDEFRRFNPSTIIKSADYLNRHKITTEQLHLILKKFQYLKVVVIGDMIVDEYISCDPIGLSQEDPTIVVTPVYSEKFIGGAGIVSAHASGLGADVSFFSVVGDDENAEFVEVQLRNNKVNAWLLKDESRPTTLKQRFRANNKTLLRVSHLRQHALSSDFQDKLLSAITSVLPGTNLVVFSDFNYGCLPQPLVDRISSFCLEHKILMVADSQSSSQFGDVSRFKGMLLLTPTEREARLSVRDNNSGLIVITEQLKEKARAQNIIMTLGGEGVIIQAESSDGSDWKTDRLPAMNTAPRDVAGAGDSLLICVAMALASGSEIWHGAYLGSLAAACQVGRLGNIPLTLDDIIAEIDN